MDSSMDLKVLAERLGEILEFEIEDSGGSISLIGDEFTLILNDDKTWDLIENDDSDSENWEKPDDMEIIGE